MGSVLLLADSFGIAREIAERLAPRYTERSEVLNETMAETPPAPGTPEAAPVTVNEPPPSDRTEGSVAVGEEPPESLAAEQSSPQTPEQKGIFGRALDRYRSWNERRKTLNEDKKVHEAQSTYDVARADEARFKQSVEDLVKEIGDTEVRMIAMGTPLSEDAKQNMKSGLQELLRLQEDARQRAVALETKLNLVKEAQRVQEEKADAVAARINGPYEVRQVAFNKQQEVLERERSTLAPQVELWRGEVNGLEKREQELVAEIKKMKRSSAKYQKMSELNRIQREKQWKASRLSLYERDLASYNYSLGWIDERAQSLLKKKVPVLGETARAAAEALKKERPTVPKRASSQLPWKRTGRRAVAMQ